MTVPNPLADHFSPHAVHFIYCGRVAFSIAWIIVWGILFSISGYLALVAVPLRLLISLGIFAFWLFLMHQAYNQREYRTPFLGAIAVRQVR